MGLTSSIIETGVDRLVKLVNLKGRISSQDAATQLAVSMTIIMEWSNFLEEEGIINIEYKFAKPFLVARKLAKKDILEKMKEFSGKKEGFIRKAEGSLSFLDRESKKLGRLKEEYDKIGKELGFGIGNIKNELEELKKYQELKISLDRQIEDQKESSMEKLNEITNQIINEKRKYEGILTEIKKEEVMLGIEKSQADSIEKGEKLIEEKLSSLREFIKKVEDKVKAEEEGVKVSEANIQNLILMSQNAKTRIEKEKGLIEPLVNKSNEQTEKIKQLQDAIINKIISKEKKLGGVKEASKKIKSLFKERVDVINFIEKINKDKNDLQDELIALIKKAKSFQLSSKSADIGKDMLDIEKKFTEVNNKKNIFEKELKRLRTFLK